MSPATIVYLLHLPELSLSFAQGYLSDNLGQEYERVMVLRILITGGAGFIGSNFLRRILLDGIKFGINHVRVLDKLSYSGSLSNFRGLDSDSFEFIRGDVCDPHIADRSLNGIDIVFHFAAESHVDRSINSSRVFFETNVVGTQTLLEQSLKNNVGSFIHISTDEVYGSIQEGSWNEEFPLSPNSPYAASKASSDLLSLSFARTFGMDVRVTRCSNNYGANQFPEKIIPLFVTNLIEGKKVPVYGSGNNVRDWLHVQDHCKALLLVAHEGRAGEVYNIGGGQELKNIDLTKIILNEFGYNEDWIDYVPDRKGHDFRYSVNISKAQNELGYQPSILFKEGIKDTINWYRENQDWWKPLRT
jgi:dTDP-glucose 4,6-dehydratase